MTIAELKEAIKDLPDDMPVILEKDAEGNGYSPLASLNIGWYEAVCSYAGEVRWSDDFTANENYPHERATIQSALRQSPSIGSNADDSDESGNQGQVGCCSQER